MNDVLEGIYACVRINTRTYASDAKRQTDEDTHNQAQTHTQKSEQTDKHRQTDRQTHTHTKTDRLMCRRAHLIERRGAMQLR